MLYAGYGQAGVDSAWEQRKLEARKLLENAAESPASSAHGVGQVLQDGFELEPFIYHCANYWADPILQPVT